MKNSEHGRGPIDMLEPPTSPLTCFEDLLRNVDRFGTPLPTTANRISTIVSASSTPETVKSQILDDARRTRIILHHQVADLIDDFLAIKRTSGTTIERTLYDGLSRAAFLQRLILKRPLSFVGSSDSTVTRDGQFVPDAEQLWPLVGTDKEREPLLLRDYLSYDEMPLSALIGVSSPTFFINAGARQNMGKRARSGEYTSRGVYVGLVGARFEKPDQMESRFLIESGLYCTENRGYGFSAEATTHEQAILQVWARFYGVNEVKTGLQGFPIIENPSQISLVMERYKQRLAITLESFLLEAESRGKEENRPVRAFLVGLGLGVWMLTSHQTEAYVEVLIETIQKLPLETVEIVELSWVKDTWEGKGTLCITAKNGKEVTVMFTRSDPAARRDDSETRLLVACYAWDGNSFPGNEVWWGSLTASGDPAAVCCSTIGELQNAYVNPFSDNIHILGKDSRM
jgi:Domain of unknown function (DUF4804)